MRPRLPLPTAAALLLLTLAANAANAQQTPTPPAPPTPPAADLEGRVRALEDEVRALRAAGQPAPAPSPIILDPLFLRTDTPPLAPGPYTIRSADGRSFLKVGGLLQANLRAFAGRSEDGGRTGNSSFFLRRARPILDGNLGGALDFRLMPDFFEGRAVLQDGYGELRVAPGIGVRAGKFKVPFSLIVLQNAAELPLAERSFATTIAPIRDVGIQVAGLNRAGVEWALGVFNGSPEGGFTDLDADNEKEVIGRVFYRPAFARTPYAGLGVGFAAAYGRSAEPLTGVVRTVARSAFFRYADGAVGNGDRLRLAPQAYYYTGPLGLQAEYIETRHEVRRDTAGAGSARATARLSGLTVQANYVLTGEAASFRNPVPRRPFAAGRGGGAWEVAARYARFRADGEPFARGIIDRTVSADRADAYTLGVNWYLTPQIKTQFSYERTEFGRPIRFGPGLTRRREDALLYQLQVGF